MVGPRVFTVDEANALIPEFESAFVEIDELRERLKSAKVKLNALEMIWGNELNSNDCPDRPEALDVVEQLKSIEEEIAAVVSRLNTAGATVKDVQAGLLDVYHVRDGRLVFLCWKRGETEFEAWHHVDTGFAHRQSL